MHDVPYTNRVAGPEITSSMTVIANAVRSLTNDVPLGIQILSGCNQEALAVAKVKLITGTFCTINTRTQRSKARTTS